MTIVSSSRTLPAPAVSIVIAAPSAVAVMRALAIVTDCPGASAPTVIAGAPVTVNVPGSPGPFLATTATRLPTIVNGG